MVTALENAAADIGALRVDASQEEIRRVVDGAFMHCRALYTEGRSAEGLPVARKLLERCGDLGDRLQVRRSAIMCGLLAADSGDIVGAIEYFMQALKLAIADDDRPTLAAVWNNMGLVFGITGNYENAVRCFRRGLAVASPDASCMRHRHVAHSNIAVCLYHLGRMDEGMKSGEQALLEETDEIIASDIHSAVTFRRNLVRLMIATGRSDEAGPRVAEALRLAADANSKRARIAAELAQASLDLARGHSDVALTRVENAVERARQVPAALRDALACAIRSEEAAGHPARALVRLKELSDLIYNSGIERVRRNIAQAGFADAVLPQAVGATEHERARLESMVESPMAPEGWKALQRLGAGAVMRMDPTGWHGMRVGALVKAFALYRGESPLQALEYGFAAEVHDIGMMAVPEAVLAKRGLLNSAEREIVDRHAEAGAQMLCDDQHPRMLLAREVARYHHARWDGTGHPARVGGEFIPLAARMCAVADAYDAMICGLSGRESRTMAEALQELRQGAGTQFDPELVGEFDEMIRGEMEGRGVDLGEGRGMQDFLGLIQSLTEDRGFV